MILFFDACTLIYWQEAKEPFYSELKEKLQTLYQQYPNAQVAVSRLSQLECLVKPYKDDDLNLITRYQDFFANDDLITIELTERVILQAVSLRAEIKALKTPDALQAASALSISDDVIFVTNDAVFEKVNELTLQLL